MITARKQKEVPPLMMGKIEFKLESDDLDPIYKKKATEELRETPEIVAEGLEGLRELLKSEPDLVFPEKSDEFLYKFLRPCKWYPKSAFELMKRFYDFRRTHPKLCEGLTPAKEKSALLSGMIMLLPRRCADGSRLFLAEVSDKWNPKELSLEQVFKGVMILFAAAITEPVTQVCGVRVILDMGGLSLSHVPYFSPSFARSLLEWVQRCFPFRLKGVHIINQPFIFNMVFAIFKPFLQEKLKKRIHFHGANRKELKEYIGSKALPNQYEGDLELPNESSVEDLWKYFCNFESEYEDKSYMVLNGTRTGGINSVNPTNTVTLPNRYSNSDRERAICESTYEYV